MLYKTSVRFPSSIQLKPTLTALWWVRYMNRCRERANGAAVSKMPRHSKERTPWRHAKRRRKRAVRAERQSLHTLSHFRTRNGAFVRVITSRKDSFSIVPLSFTVTPKWRLAQPGRHRRTATSHYRVWSNHSADGATNDPPPSSSRPITASAGRRACT